jgi:aminoglycoside phosphotransferase (APT) family kinase protein
MLTRPTLAPEDFNASDLEVVESIMRRFRLSPGKAEIVFLGAGSCNNNYLASHKDKKLVVKLSKPDREYKAASEYKKEQWCLDKAHSLAIPSPIVLEVGKEQGRAYMIQSYVEGTVGAALDDKSSLAPLVQLQVWRKLGEYARKIHTIPVTGWGEELESDGVFTGSWAKHLQYNIASLSDNDPLVSMGVLTHAQSDVLKGELLALEQKPIKFGLNHGDLALRNTIIDTSGQVSLLDWGTARAELVPYFDINEILRSTKPNQETLQAFLDGYGISASEFEGMQSGLRILNLLHVVDTMRWAIDRMPSVIQEHAQRVKEAIAKSGI